MPGNQSKEEVVLAYEPDLSLQKMIGEGVQFKDIITLEIRQACQKLISDARDSFFEEEKQKVEEIRALAKKVNFADLPKISSIASELKAQARMFGFSFICNLCDQIVMFSDIPGKSVDVRFMVISRFVDALYIAMIQKMHDEGGELEKELNLSVEHLKN